MTYTRREAGRLALAALPATRLLARPNSKIGGVQVGIIAPYAFRGAARTAEEILKGMVDLGISAVELQSEAVEPYAGIPGGGGRGGGGRGRGTLTPEQQEARKKAVEDVRNWRLSVSMDKYKALRRMYQDAGVSIYGFKLGFTDSMTDAEYDYVFNVAAALGANQVTMELPNSVELTKRIGDFAARRKIYVAYHNHTQVNEQSWDAALAQSPYNALNLDVGHFTAAISKDPIPFIRQHHARIKSMHFKDRKYGTNGSANMPWGQGDTPLKGVLQLMKKERYDFPATIELEYPVPEGSTPMAELGKCLKFCQDALA